MDQDSEHAASGSICLISTSALLCIGGEPAWDSAWEKAEARTTLGRKRTNPTIQCRLSAI